MVIHVFITDFFSFRKTVILVLLFNFRICFEMTVFFLYAFDLYIFLLSQSVPAFLKMILKVSI